MVTVGHVEFRDPAAGLHQGVPVDGIAHHPHDVLDAVGRDEIVRRLCCGESLNQHIDLGSRLVGQKNRSGIGVERIHVAGAVVLLDPPRILMLFDQAGLVLVDTGARNKTGLHVVPHALPVEIERRTRLVKKDAVILEAL